MAAEKVGQQYDRHQERRLADMADQPRGSGNDLGLAFKPHSFGEQAMVHPRGSGDDLEFRNLLGTQRNTAEQVHDSAHDQSSN